MAEGEWLMNCGNDEGEWLMNCGKLHRYHENFEQDKEATLTMLDPVINMERVSTTSCCENNKCMNKNLVLDCPFTFVSLL
jgi:hypothetical protein